MGRLILPFHFGYVVNLALLLIGICVNFPISVHAEPSGGQVVGGQGSIYYQRMKRGQVHCIVFKIYSILRWTPSFGQRRGDFK
jgi:hypothetical protein